jgi:hypothetical protein
LLFVVDNVIGVYYSNYGKIIIRRIKMIKIFMHTIGSSYATTAKGISASIFNLFTQPPNVGIK